MKILNTILLVVLTLASFSITIKEDKTANNKTVTAVETIAFKHYIMAMVEDEDSEPSELISLNVELLEVEAEDSDLILHSLNSLELLETNDEDCSTFKSTNHILPLQLEEDEASVVIALD